MDDLYVLKIDFRENQFNSTPKFFVSLQCNEKRQHTSMYVKEWNETKRNRRN